MSLTNSIPTFIAPSCLSVTSLRLQNFRNYHTAELITDENLIVLTGANGSGKTNILEALSLLNPGRGLRRARLSEFARDAGPGSWAVSATFNCNGDKVNLGTGLSAPVFGEDDGAREVRINGKTQKPSDLGIYLSLLWLTPEHDGLFRGPAGERRRFLDRLITALDPLHSARVTALEKLLRSRNKLLCEARPDEKWLNAVEHELAEAAIAVSAARLSHVASLRQSINTHHDSASPFPFAVLELTGEIETSLQNVSSVEAEDLYRDTLRAMRRTDAEAGRTTRGSHLCDLDVEHGPKAIPAARASTGEQKALLVGLILAQARHIREHRALAPLLLLDEIAAHFDAWRRAALYDALENLGCQAWMTGTDPEMFSTLRGRANFVEVVKGMLSLC